MARLPRDGAEALRWLAVGVAIAILAIVAYYAVNVIVAVGITLAILVAVGFVLVIVGGRLWDALRHGKPLIRGDWGGDGGES